MKNTLIKVIHDSVNSTCNIYYPYTGDVSEFSLKTHGGYYNEKALGSLIWNPMVNEYEYIYRRPEGDIKQLITKTRIR